jgi:hypothetical protein
LWPVPQVLITLTGFGPRAPPVRRLRVVRL